MCSSANSLWYLFSMLLKHAFGDTKEGVFLRARSDGRLFNLDRLRAKTKVIQALIRDLLFADDAAIATHSENELQFLMDRLSAACKDLWSDHKYSKNKNLAPRCC